MADNHEAVSPGAPEFRADTNEYARLDEESEPAPSGEPAVASAAVTDSVAESTTEQATAETGPGEAQLLPGTLEAKQGSTPPENLDLSHLGSFEEVKEELALTLGDDGLYRNRNGRIVVFRAQQINYPTAMIAQTNRYAGGIYGLGAYFANSPRAASHYAKYLDTGMQAYLLPEIDPNRIEYTSRSQALEHRYDETTDELKVFSVDSDRDHRKRRLTHAASESSGRQLWVVIPGSAKETIGQVQRLAYLGRIGTSEPRFKRTRRLADRLVHQQPPPSKRPLNEILREYSERDYKSDTEAPKLTREGLDTALQEDNYSPQALINYFKQDFSEEFIEYSGPERSSTIEAHTKLVLAEFDHYWSDKPLPLGVDANFMRVVLALHDIRVGEAYRMGNTYLQHEYTAPVVARTFDRLGYSPQQRDLAVAIIAGDPIGEVLKAPEDGTEAYTQLATEDILEKAQALGVPAQEFFDLVFVYYMSDAGSYTTDAGGEMISGEPSQINKIMDIDRKNRVMKLKPKAQRVVDRLRERLGEQSASSPSDASAAPANRPPYP